MSKQENYSLGAYIDSAIKAVAKSNKNKVIKTIEFKSNSLIFTFTDLTSSEATFKGLVEFKVKE